MKPIFLTPIASLDKGFFKNMVSQNTINIIQILDHHSRLWQIKAIYLSSIA